MLIILVVFAALTTVQCKEETVRRKNAKDAFLAKLESEFPGYKGRPMPPELRDMIQNHTKYKNSDLAEDCMTDFGECMAVHKYSTFCAMDLSTNKSKLFPSLCEYAYRVCMDGEDFWMLLKDSECSHIALDEEDNFSYGLDWAFGPNRTEEPPLVQEIPPLIQAEEPQISDIQIEQEVPKIEDVQNMTHEIITNADEITIKADEITTKAGEITTKAGEITTKAHETTTKGSARVRPRAIDPSTNAEYIQKDPNNKVLFYRASLDMQSNNFHNDEVIAKEITHLKNTSRITEENPKKLKRIPAPAHFNSTLNFTKIIKITKRVFKKPKNPPVIARLNATNKAELMKMFGKIRNILAV